MIWDHEHETMARPELERLQLQRLQAKVKDVYEKVPLYRQRMQEADLTPDSIRSLDDLKKLPFTSKQDFRDTYPFGMVAVPKEKIVRIHASSGTTGKPIAMASSIARGIASRSPFWAMTQGRTNTSARRSRGINCS